MEREAVKEKAHSLNAEVWSFSDDFENNEKYILKKDLPIDHFFEEAVFNESEKVWINRLTNREIIYGKNSFVSNYIEFEGNKPKEASYQVFWENGDAPDGEWTSNPAKDLPIWNIRSKFRELPDIVEIDLIRERQNRYGEINQLPDGEKNIAGKAQIDKDIMNSDDWLKAKSGDLEAAERVVDSLWSSRKTSQLKELIKDPENKVLVTMPSTSRKNVIPVVLAKKIAKDLHIPVIQGDKYFDVLHRNEIKNISRFERIFYDREFKTNEPFDKNIRNKKAILIDDIFTTGGSVKAFSQALAVNELEVSNVIGLMGDKRFRLDDKTTDKVKDVLSEHKIDVDIERLSKNLTRTEAGLLIQRLNREKGLKNEKRGEFAGRIQGLVKGIPVKDITRNRITERDPGTERAHFNNERNVERIQGGRSRGQGR